jgi:hypothetical protein
MSHRRCVPRLGWASQNSPSWQAKGLSCRAAGNKGSHCRTCRQRGEGGQGGAHRGGFFGKPLRVIFRFRHQNAHNPPSPTRGEGGRGMRGKSAPECRKSLISPEKSTFERQGVKKKGVRMRQTPASLKNSLPARREVLSWHRKTRLTSALLSSTLPYSSTPDQRYGATVHTSRAMCRL